jgi:TPR repeat protein
MPMNKSIAGVQCEYSTVLTDGIGVVMDISLGAHYFKLSAEQGNGRAQFAYSRALSNGHGACCALFQHGAR